MPRQILRPEEVIQLASRARLVRVVRREEFVKIKLRTQKALYTYVCEEREAKELLEKIKELKKEIIEL